MRTNVCFGGIKVFIVQGHMLKRKKGKMYML